MSEENQNNESLPIPIDSARDADLQSQIAELIHKHTWCVGEASVEAADAVMMFLRERQVGSLASSAGEEPPADPSDRSPQPFPRVCPTCAGAGKVVPWAEG